MDKNQVAVNCAHQVFYGLGFEGTIDRLSQSILATAWEMGLPRPSGIFFRSNPWAGVSIRYHYEEALVLRFWAMQAELLFGYVTKVMHLCEAELAVPVKEFDLMPLDVLRAMTHWSLALAGQRARVVGSPGTLSPEQAVEIFNSRVFRYETLVSESVLDTRPIPDKDFQLGLSRDHPWTALLCYCADNLCESLDTEPDLRPMTALTLQLALSARHASFYHAVKDRL
jgi:hypothetical protein